IVRALLTQHDPAHIAAAFVRLYRKGQAAPEDLAPAPEALRGPAPSNFTSGAWVALSIGRDRQAEPRWLIPMLCKAGGISKRQLGSIRIDQNETFVEIDAASIDAFMRRIGEGGRLEKSIHARRIDHPPGGGYERRPKPPGARLRAEA